MDSFGTLEREVFRQPKVIGLFSIKVQIKSGKFIFFFVLIRVMDTLVSIGSCVFDLTFDSILGAS